MFSQKMNYLCIRIKQHSNIYMKTVLLHCCCAPCSSAILEWMMNNDVRPVLYYCNPNIFPEEEYMICKN